jgi:hypothetical protein
VGAARAARLGLAGAGAELLNAGTEVVNRVLGVPGLAANLAGHARPKRLRVCAVILRAPDRPLATEQAVREALEVADGIFRREAETELVWDEWPRVHTVEDPSPGYALDVDCGANSWKQDLGGAGAYFRRTLEEALGDASAAGARATGHARPIGVFVVRDIAGKAGCSLGPLSDYVTVDRVRGPLIAHELGHSCGLWHTKEDGNLMLPAANREAMTRVQRAIFRNSRHVTR